jgi:hypothetical protein
MSQLFDGPKRSNKTGTYSLNAASTETRGGGEEEEEGRGAGTGIAKHKSKSKKVQRGKKKGVETLMVVYYGRTTESIGAITVIDSATYADVRALIRPLIDSYYHRLKEVEGWEGRHVDDGFSDKSDAFSIPDAQGNVVPKELEFVRCFCALRCLHFLTSSYLCAL